MSAAISVPNVELDGPAASASRYRSIASERRLDELDGQPDSRAVKYL